MMTDKTMTRKQSIVASIYMLLNKKQTPGSIEMWNKWEIELGVPITYGQRGHTFTCVFHAEGRVSAAQALRSDIGCRARCNGGCAILTGTSIHLASDGQG